MHNTQAETHKARKKHRCEWCWQVIEPGTEYKRYRFYDAGDAATIKMHPECFVAMEIEAEAEGGFIEGTPGQERPTPNAEVTGARAPASEKN